MNPDDETRRLARAEATLGPPDARAALLKWARVVARGVCTRHRIEWDSPEGEELEATARLALWARAGEFDPSRVPPGGDFVGAFKGYAHPTVTSSCEQHAERLKNGGTYHTRSPGLPPVVVVPLPVRRGPDGVEYVDVPDPRAAEPPDPGDPAAARVPALLTLLRPVERLCVALLYGLPPAARPHDHAEAAAALRMPRDRVRAVERAALEKLRGVLT